MIIIIIKTVTIFQMIVKKKLITSRKINEKDKNIPGLQ